MKLISATLDVCEKNCKKCDCFNIKKVLNGTICECLYFNNYRKVPEKCYINKVNLQLMTAERKK